jgi:hypothetical protein
MRRLQCGRTVGASIGEAMRALALLLFTVGVLGAIGLGVASAVASVWARPGQLVEATRDRVVLSAITAADTGMRAAASARVGAFYFDGWSGPLSNFHFGGLLQTPYSGREPLFGWRDASLDSMRTQLAWAHQDGIGFFAFDWYFHPDPGNGPINAAHYVYLSLHQHDGVGYALTYVNQPGFVIPPDQWASVAHQWVTEDFLNPNYVRVDGKPLLIILDEHAFNVQMGGAAGVNAAIATLQNTAHRHGLPGVFVVGGLYLDSNSVQCFPLCLDTGKDLQSEHYDALTEFSYPYILAPEDGARPYPEVAAAIKSTWDVIAQRSPVPHIPSVMAGFDARPVILAGQVQPPDQGGWPLLLGHETWFSTTPGDVGGLVRDGVNWVQANPSMRVEPAPAPPLVLIQSWNELQEGAIMLATHDSGYGFGQALATALGLPWTTTHARAITFTIERTTLTGSISVPDGWTPCAAATVSLQRHAGGRWQLRAKTTTTSAGSFRFRLHTLPAAYRLQVPASIRYQQTCQAATSKTLP